LLDGIEFAKALTSALGILENVVVEDSKTSTPRSIESPDGEYTDDYSSDEYAEG
jgi:hypothetical protein